MPTPPLVTTQWLAEHLQDPSVIPVDASWHMPDSGRNAEQEYKGGLIPGAIFFDIDKVVAPSSSLPHTFPSEEVFAANVRALGIGNTDILVIYDKSDLHTAARAWWMFRAMGHNDVYVLDGGFAKWVAENQPVTSEVTKRPKSSFSAHLNASLLKTQAKIESTLTDEKEQIVDARAPGRFHGTVPEPRPGLRSGHIPQARNVPFSTLYDEGGTLKASSALQNEIQKAGIDMDLPVTTSCGSGVTACNLALAFAVLGKWDVAVYDGSWTEWGSNPDLPLET